MTRILKAIRRFLRIDHGPTAVEYAVMLMLIVALCFTAIQLIGGALSSNMNDSATKIQDAFND